MLGPWESGIESLHGTLGISQRLTVLLATCLIVQNESERNVRLLTLSTRSTRSTRSLRTYSFLHLRLTALHPAFCQLYLGLANLKGMNHTFLAARFLLTLNGCAVSALAHDLPAFLFAHFSVAVLIKGRKKWQSKGLHGNETLADGIDAVDVDAVDADAVNPPLAAGHQDLCICTRWAFQVAVSHAVSQPQH